jgi:hypothetical protein
MKRNTFWKDTGILAIVVACLTILSSVLLNFAYEKFGFFSTILSVFLVIGLVFAVSFSAFKCLYSQLSDRIEDLEGAVHSARAAFGKEWLISREELMILEGKTKANEVWIISRSLHEETDKKTFLPIVKNNIKRGVKYTYVVPDSDLIRAKVAKIRSAHGVGESVYFRFISDELFDLVAVQDIAVFGPIGEKGEDMVAYMNLPIGEAGSDYFIALSREFAERLVGRLLRMAETQSTERKAD